MKNINIKKSLCVLLATSMLFSACDKDFEKINTDPIGRGSTTAGQLLAPALNNVLHANMLRNRNFNNELMQVTVNISDAEAQVFRYDFRRTWADYTWNTWYPELTNLKDVGRIASEPGQENKSYQGISLIAQSWVYQLLTDVYGDVPYSEANEGRQGVYEPKFDAQKDIYQDLFKKFEEANNLLKDGTSIVVSSDPVFQGDVSKWRRFGNSLYLRALLRVAHKPEVSAAAIAKIKEIIETRAAEYPIMEDNTHTAKILWNGTNSSSAVFSSPFMISVRAVDFRTPAITEFFIDHLRNWNDPRMQGSLGVNGTPRWGIAQGPNGWAGVPSGYAPGAGVVKQAYFYSDAQGAGITLQTDRYTGILMNVAEVNFIKAEAAARGWISGSPEVHYYTGIGNGINYWLPNHFTGPNDAKFAKYIQEADIMWDNNLPLDNKTPGSNSKLEMIHLQKYYAMFMVDFQQWIEYRRTGHPILPKGQGLANGGEMPARLNYPIITQSANPTNYRNAVAAQGADDINTKVWWQKP